MSLVDFTSGVVDFMPQIVRDYLLDIADEDPPQKRRLQATSEFWDVGTWYFESINQVRA